MRVPVVQALVRERLCAKLDRVWDHRLSLIVAPTGSGKTTLLAQFAAGAPSAVAWYEAARAEGSADRLVHQLGSVLTSALGHTSVGLDIEDIVGRLEEVPDRSLLLLVDDLHELDGTPAEGALERLIALAPPSLTVLAASRRPPNFNLSRLRVAEALLEIDGDDLRFRSWEVERLFHEFYRMPLGPEDLAELARRTEGWAAGLQLFHLATRNKSASERRRTLQALARRTRLFREYLAENLLDELPAELRHFLVQTSVLGRLTGPICDDLLDLRGSDGVLREIERRQIFTCRLDDDGAYRYHEVLRTHLEAHLVDQQGEAAAREHHRRAGAVLERAGALSEAVQAYSRGEDWAAVTKLLEQQGQVAIEGPGAWVDSLPAPLVHQDPWLILALARHRLTLGQWRGALEAYEQAERAFGPVTVAEACRRERLAVTAWLDPVAAAPADWTGVVRRALRGDPLAAAQDANDLEAPFDSLARAACLLLAGHAGEAHRTFQLVVEEGEASPAVVAGCRLGAAAAALLAGDPNGVDFVRTAQDELEQLGLLCLAQLVLRCLDRLTEPPGSKAAESVARPALPWTDEDPWASAILTGVEEVAGRDGDEGSSPDGLTRLRDLGAPVLEAWGRAGRALVTARRGQADALTTAQGAATLARRLRVPGAHALACRALALVDPVGASQQAALADALEGECGLDLGRWTRRGDGVTDFHRCPLVLRCFGTFRLEVHGRELDLAGVRPRARSVLRLLAARGGQPVHREVLLEALWPDADERAGNRSLQVAVSSLRQALEAADQVGRSVTVGRAGETYRLVLPAGADVDVTAFESLTQQARLAEATGDLAGAVDAWERALEAYGGDLLPLDGPAEWVVKERDRFRVAAADCAHHLARLLLDRGEWARAAETCQRGLAIDRYRDGLWHLLVTALEDGSEVASAARARARYREMLSELGLRAEPGPD